MVMCGLALEPRYIALNVLLFMCIVFPTAAGWLTLMGGIGYAVYRDERSLNAVGSTVMNLSWYVLKLSAHIEVFSNRVMRWLESVPPHSGSLLDRDTMYMMSDDPTHQPQPTTYDIVSVNEILRATSIDEYRSMVETESICNPTFKQDYVAFVRRMGRVGMFPVDDVDGPVVSDRLVAATTTTSTQWIECELRYYMDGDDVPTVQHSIDIRDATRYIALAGNNLFTPQFFRWYGVDAGIVVPADWKRISKCTAAVIDGDINTHEYSYDVVDGTSGTSGTCMYAM